MSTATAPIGLDDPITLEEACEIEYRGRLKPADLRRQHERGNLVIEKIGRKEFVTIRDVKAMRERCRVSQEVRDCGLNQVGSTKPEAPAAPSGSSRTEDAEKARASLLANAKKLKGLSPSTSSKPATKSAPATVTPLKSSSTTSSTST